jgi:hypothetical protein
MCRYIDQTSVTIRVIRVEQGSFTKLAKMRRKIKVTM